MVDTDRSQAIAPGLVEPCIRLGEWKARNGPQSYYQTLQSTQSYASRGKRPDRSGGGRSYWNGPGGGDHMPAVLAPESRWSHPSNTFTPATNPYHSIPSHRYRTPWSSQLGSSVSLTSARYGGNRIPISNLPGAFGHER